MTDDVKPMERDALSKLAECRTKKSYIELDLREAYFFTAPWRQRQISSMTQPAQQRMLDAPELNTDIAFLICQDFVTEIVNTFMPEAQQWCERGPGMDLPDGIWDKIKDDIKKDDKKIFNAMKASNLYPEITKSFYPDLAIGTVGLWIDRPHPHKAIVVSAIPIREFEINLGPYGEIDDRFAVRYTRNCYVEELVGPDIWAKIDAELKKTIEDKGSERTQVVWGFWRKWDDKTDECWQHIVLVGDKLVHDAELKGEGCCPLIIARFNPSADWPHGQGPMLEGLPTFRQIDELKMLRMEQAAREIKPPIFYPDDSFAAIEQGLEDGMAYPIRLGSEKSIGSIYPPVKAEAANFQYDEDVKNLRKLFFVDYPEQTGDTPPTLGQWLDEMARSQRRIGTPGLPFWAEGPAAIFTRFKYLLEAAGAIQPVKVDGRAVATLPRNPAQAAAEQQEVGMAMKMATYLAQTFPEEFKMYIDGNSSMKAMLEKSRVTLLKYRDADQVAEAVKQMSQLIGDRPVPGQQAQQGGPGPVAG
jgi:head-to-tail connecting protein